MSKTLSAVLAALSLMAFGAVYAADATPPAEAAKPHKTVKNTTHAKKGKAEEKQSETTAPAAVPAAAPVKK